jgi:hypothetical protein
MRIYRAAEQHNMPPRLEDTESHKGNAQIGLLYCASSCLGVLVAEKVSFSSLPVLGS